MGFDEQDDGKDDLDDELLSLNENDWIDVRIGLANSGSKDAYMPLLKIFYESMEEKADEIEGFYRDGNLKDYTIKVHALKSSARLIGAMEFGEKAQELENAGKSDDIEFIRKHHEVFMDELRSFKEPLAALFEKGGSDEDKPEADPTLMSGVFEEIKSAADDMDCDRLESVFEEMEDYRIPADDKELFDRLKDAAGMFDYDAILELLNSK